LTILGCLVATAASGLAFIYSGLYDLSALTPDGGLVACATHAASDRSAGARLSSRSAILARPERSATRLPRQAPQRYSPRCSRGPAASPAAYSRRCCSSILSGFPRQFLGRLRGIGWTQR